MPESLTVPPRGALDLAKTYCPDALSSAGLNDFALKLNKAANTIQKAFWIKHHQGVDIFSNSATNYLVDIQSPRYTSIQPFVSTVEKDRNTEEHTPATSSTHLGFSVSVPHRAIYHIGWEHKIDRTEKLTGTKNRKNIASLIKEILDDTLLNTSPNNSQFPWLFLCNDQYLPNVNSYYLIQFRNKVDDSATNEHQIAHFLVFSHDVAKEEYTLRTAYKIKYKRIQRYVSGCFILHNQPSLHFDPLSILKAKTTEEADESLATKKEGEKRLGEFQIKPETSLLEKKQTQLSETLVDKLLEKLNEMKSQCSRLKELLSVEDAEIGNKPQDQACYDWFLFFNHPPHFFGI